MGDDNGIIVVVPRVILVGAIAPVASTPYHHRRPRHQPPTAEAISRDPRGPTGVWF